MTAGDFIKREMEIAREVTKENPNATMKQLQTLTGMRINQERIKTLSAEGYTPTEIATFMGLKETVIRREIAKYNS